MRHTAHSGIQRVTASAWSEYAITGHCHPGTDGWPEQYHDEHSDNQEWMQAVFAGGFVYPPHQFFHFARRIKGCGGFKHNADFLAMLIKGDNMIGQIFVISPMALVLAAMPQQGLVKLADMVFGDVDIIKSLEDHVHCFGITGHFLLIAGIEGCGWQI